MNATTTTTTISSPALSRRADHALVTTLVSAGYPPAIARQRVASGPDALAFAIAAHCPFIDRPSGEHIVVDAESVIDDENRASEATR